MKKNLEHYLLKFLWAVNNYTILNLLKLGKIHQHIKVGSKVGLCPNEQKWNFGVIFSNFGNPLVANIA